MEADRNGGECGSRHKWRGGGIRTVNLRSLYSVDEYFKIRRTNELIIRVGRLVTSRQYQEKVLRLGGSYHTLEIQTYGKEQSPSVLMVGAQRWQFNRDVLNV